MPEANPQDPQLNQAAPALQNPPALQDQRFITPPPSPGREERRRRAGPPPVIRPSLVTGLPSLEPSQSDDSDSENESGNESENEVAMPPRIRPPFIRPRMR